MATRAQLLAAADLDRRRMVLAADMVKAIKAQRQRCRGGMNDEFIAWICAGAVLQGEANNGN